MDTPPSHCDLGSNASMVETDSDNSHDRMLIADLGCDPGPSHGESSETNALASRPIPSDLEAIQFDCKKQTISCAVCLTNPPSFNVH